jgi:hypothetical protein
MLRFAKVLDLTKLNMLSQKQPFLRQQFSKYKNILNELQKEAETKSRRLSVYMLKIQFHHLFMEVLHGRIH